MSDRTTVEGEVRRRLGDLPEAQLPNEQVSAALDAALREFSRYRPIKDEIELRVTDGQSEYEAPEGTFGVEDFFYLPFDAIDIFTAEPIPYSEWEADDDMWARLRKDVFLKKEEIEPDVQVIPGTPPVFRVHPASKTEGIARLRIRKLVTIELLNAADVEHVVRYAQGDCLEYIGRKRSKSVTKVPTATGQLYLDNGKDFREEGRELKCEFHEALGGGATMVGRG